MSDTLKEKINKNCPLQVVDKVELRVISNIFRSSHGNEKLNPLNTMTEIWKVYCSLQEDEVEVCR